MKKRVVIADVLYCVTDETYYVLQRASVHNKKYNADSVWEAFKLLKEDGWAKCGKVQRSDYSVVDMLTRGDEYIAIWTETDFDEKQDLLIESIADQLINDEHEEFDYKKVPVEKRPPIYKENQKVYLRNKNVSLRALKHAEYQCEIDAAHATFIRRRDNLPYMEPHHLVPMEYSDFFDVSLDVEENIVSLCSNCHNNIHYGKDSEKLLKLLFEKRKELLEAVDIRITLDDLMEMYL